MYPFSIENLAYEQRTGETRLKRSKITFLNFKNSLVPSGIIQRPHMGYAFSQLEQEDPDMRRHYQN